MRKSRWLIAIGVILIIMVLVVSIILSMAPPRSSSSSNLQNVPVGTFLYLWYGGPGPQTGLGTPGWNSPIYPGGGAVVDTPMIGYYSSDTNQTFAWQVSQMQRAGFSFAIVSWWGPSIKNETGMINKASHDLFAYLKTSNSSFKVAIMVDAYNGTNNLSRSSLKADYNYVYDSFVKPFGNSYFGWGGKPLLLFFNPIYPAYDNSSYSIRTIGNRPNPVNWIFWDAPARYFQSQDGSMNATNDFGQPSISGDGEVTLVPRIDSYYNLGYQGGSYLRFDASLAGGLYQEQWGYVLNHTSSVKLVLVYGWNEYHERTSIEPHEDYTAQVNSTYLADLTAHYVAQLQ